MASKTSMPLLRDAAAEAACSSLLASDNSTRVRKTTTVHAGDPTVDGRAFRRCLGQFATGVTVIAAATSTHRVGVTVNSFASLSLDPPLILWSIRRASGSLPVFQAATHFSVNFLSADQIDVSQRFASADVDKFAGTAWSSGRTGAPILAGVVGSLECRREATYEGGDHVIIVGRVEHFAHYEGDVLLFVQGRYGIAETHPDLKKGQQTAAVDGKAPWREPPLMKLLYQAHHSLSASLEAHRKAEGVTFSQVRVLAGLYESPGLSLDALVKTMYLGHREAEDSVNELVERSYIVRHPNGLLSLTPEGRRCREAIARRLAEFEAEQLQGIPSIEVDHGRRLLAQLIERQSAAGGV